MELKELMKNAGIVGAGGAGFPSYAKLSEGADTLIINGSECEPLLYTDFTILSREMSFVISGITLILENTGIHSAKLCIKDHTANSLSLSDGDTLANGVTVKLLRSSYPAGDEVSLIYEATGRLVRPGALPITKGVIVYNVETVYNLGRAVRLGESVHRKWVTVGGDVESPRVVTVPVGTRVKDLLSSLSIKIKEDQTVLDGGPSMGKIINPETEVVTKTTKAIIVLPRSSRAAESKRINPALASSRAETACCQCTRCTDMCPRHLLGYPLEPHKMVRTAMQAAVTLPNLVISATLCCGCGICENLACSQGISPKAVINGYKELLAKNKMRYSTNFDVEPRVERDYRIIPTKKWAEALGIARFDKKPEYAGILDNFSRIEIPLKSHIGAPSIPTVSDGDIVRRGDIIAKAADGLSVPQHASLDGKITLSGDRIIIDRID